MLSQARILYFSACTNLLNMDCAFFSFRAMCSQKSLSASGSLSFSLCLPTEVHYMTLQKYFHRPSGVSRYCQCLYRAESGEVSSSLSGFRGGFWAIVTQHPPAHHPSTGCLNTGFHGSQWARMSQHPSVSGVKGGFIARLQGRLHRAKLRAASSFL